MARAKSTARLHLLTAKQVQNAAEGDHSDGGGLLLRVRPASCSWVFRFTAPSGRRREMGMGVAYRGSAAQAGESITTARRQAHEARELLQQSVDPIDARDQRRIVAQQVEQAKKADKAREHWTLARGARDYHERVIEPSRSTKYAAQWIASLEHHVPAAIWNKPIDDVEAPELLQAMHDVRSLEDKDQRVPETLQRVRQRLTVLGRMGVRDRTTVHGLCRATFSTWANETGAARPDVIEACLAHEDVINMSRPEAARSARHDVTGAEVQEWLRPPRDSSNPKR